MSNTQFTRLQEFFEWYLTTFKMVKATYLANRYMKEVLKIPSETLRSRKKTIEFTEMKKKLIKEFEKLIRKAKKENRIEKVEYGYVLVR